MGDARSDAGVFDIPSATRFAGHTHEGLHLCAVLGGGFIEQLGRDRALATTGMVRISPSATHTIDFGPHGARCLLVRVSADDAAALRRPPRASTFIIDRRLARQAQALAHLLATPHPYGTGQELLLEILAQVSRREAARSPGPPPAWLLQSRDRLADEWRAPPDAEELAAAAGVHRVHLVRTFRDHFGCTLRGYVRRRRVAAAIHLLHTTSFSLAQIAAEAGFADQAHLTRTIRRVAGVTPRVLRGSPSLVTCVQDHPRMRALG